MHQTHPASSRTRITRGVSLFFAVALALWVGITSPTTAEAEIDAATTVSSPGDVAWHLGALPYRCVELAGDAHFCVWRVRESSEQWEQVSKLFDVTERFNLTCAFTSAKPAPIKDRCTAHLYNSGHNANAVYGKGASNDEKKKMGEEAKASIDGAANLAAVMDLVGDAPDACIEASGGAAVCEWAMNGTSPGYRAFARASGQAGKKLRALCRFEAARGAWKSAGCRVGLQD